MIENIYLVLDAGPAHTTNSKQTISADFLKFPLKTQISFAIIFNILQVLQL